MIKMSLDTKAFEKSLQDFQRKIEKATESENVPLLTLMSPAFMAANTQSSDFEAFMKAGGYSMDADEFKAIPDAEFDKHVRKHSRFGSWLEMQQEAGKAYMAAKINRAFR